MGSRVLLMSILGIDCRWSERLALIYMVEELREPLLPRCVDREKPRPDYVLVFPNVFSHNGQPTSEEPSEYKDIDIARDDLNTVLNPISNESNQFYNPQLVAQIKEKLFLGERPVDVFEYKRGLITAAVWVIQRACGLNVDLYRSRDDDEVFCVITASEEVLSRRAEDIEYRLQMMKPQELFVPKEDERLPHYTEVAPYIELIPGTSHFDKLKKYDPYTSEEAATGSLFTETDKIRLVHSILSEALNFSLLTSLSLVTTHYCVHFDLHLLKLQPKWASLKKLCVSQPIDEIRSYFGEKVAMYFAWIGTYGWCMTFTAIIGTIAFLVQYIWSDLHETVEVFFALYLSLWATFYDQLWLRREKKMSWRWGVINYSEVEEQREEFVGTLKPDPITGRLKKQLDTSWQLFRQSVSYSIVGVCIVMVIIAVLGIFLYRATLIQEYEDNPSEQKNASLYCAMLNFLQIKVMNIIYSAIARKMTNWENHETESKYVDSLSVKLALFRFVNCYISLFYIAFIKQYHEGCLHGNCDGELQMQLATIFLMNIGMNLMELGWPYLDYKLRVWLEERALQKRRQENPDSDFRFEMAYTEKQSKLDPYDTPMEDYMEMVCQYGYIVLFSSVYPVIGVLALLEILVEIRVDSWKLCVLTRRPFPHRSESIGVWSAIIELVSYLGIATNAALIVLSHAHDNLLPENPWLKFLVIEHTLLALKYLVSLVIPDEPLVVRYGLMWSSRVAAEQIFRRKHDYLHECKLFLGREIKTQMKKTDALVVEEREETS